ncbi:MAG: transcription elongation factor GreA [Minisyncoccia bacterium]
MDKAYITKEKLEALKKELEELKNKGRKEIADRLKQSKELGDLSENSEYQEARESQARLENRIRQIEEILKKAILIKKDSSSDVAKIGSVVTVKKNKELVEFTIVGSEEADPVKGFISNESPLGKNLLGKKVGDIIEINTPRGKIQYEILKIN